MQSLSKTFLLLIFLTFQLSCSKNSGDDSDETKLVLVDQIGKSTQTQSNVEEDLQTQILKINQAPSITVVLMPKKDVQASIEKLKTGGGKLVYDPNNGLGSTIPFYIAELTPEQINNTSYLVSLNLLAASVDSTETSAKPIETKLISTDLDFTNYIPTDSVNIEKLGDKTKLGEGITVAVIDTGIDASHPAFGDRVVYWYDATQETRTELKKVTVNQNTINIDLKGTAKKITLPKSITEGSEVYAAIMSEENFIGQLAEETKNEIGFLDLNTNKQADNYLVVVTKKDEQTKIYFDKTGDLKLASLDEAIAKIDYNTTSKLNRNEGMVSFPTRNNILKYPLLLEEEGEKLFINLGKTEGMHGTHVAGIIAADDQKNNLLGAAPKADLMSLRVCSGISCTDSAIIKGLYKAFYNGKVIPDVVNISLGSHEKYKRDIYSHVMNDLSAKFGTVFFISASNSGPGFRSLNHFGNSGAVVMVGANVSDKTLRDQYNLPGSANVQKESLLFFSSLGPSYTGEMKPNIIAPGAAISAVPAANGYMSQANGTSMSSPLAAGAFAAILAKTKEEIPAAFDIISEMREYHLSGSTFAKKSLLPYVFAMRDSLQNGAESLEGLTRAQQGYGLLRAGKSKELLVTYFSELNSGERDYFEVAINDYKAGYDRKLEVKKIKSFKLTLASDGERKKESLATIISKGLDIVLARVEILKSNGEVEIVTGQNMTKYFSIVDRGDSKKKLLNTHVTFNNRRTPNFFSMRSLENMEEGKNYIAHYIIRSNGAIVSNILDVVHRGFELKKREVNVPNIDTKIKSVKSGFHIGQKEIKTNVFHRYPVLVDGSVNRLDIKAAVGAGEDGRLFVQLYNPDGKEVKFVVAENSSVSSYGQAEINVSTIQKGKIQTGIWEITISTSSSGWLSSSKYDLLVQGDKFGAKNKKVKLSHGKTLVVPVQLAGDSISKLLVTNVKEVITESVKVKSSYTSFHPLKIKTGYIGNIEVNIVDKKQSYWGNLSPKLYVQSGTEFVPYEGKYKISNSVISLEENLSGAVYFALDTISNYNEASLSTKTADSVQVEFLFDLKEKLELKVSEDKVHGIDLSLVTLDATGTQEGRTIRAQLLIISGDVKEITDANGTVILTIPDTAKVNSVEINIE